MGEVPFTMDFFHSPLEAHKQEPFFLISNTDPSTFVMLRL